MAVPRQSRHDSPKGFVCIHCGSHETPDNYIDHYDSHNKSLIMIFSLATTLSCCIFCPIFILYPFMAHRSHRCRDCGIKLG